MSEWKPIETAPKDGLFLTCDAKSDDYEASVEVTWRGRSGIFVRDITDDFKEVFLDYTPTHWAEFPEPPK